MNEQEPRRRISEHSHFSRLLGKIGFVYGSGIADFGLRSTGLGIPLHKRSTLEESFENARNELDALKPGSSAEEPEAQL